MDIAGLLERNCFKFLDLPMHTLSSNKQSTVGGEMIEGFVLGLSTAIALARFPAQRHLHTALIDGKQF